MSKSNENHPIVSPCLLGSLATDNTQVPLLHFSKKSKIKSIHLLNGAAISASDSNYIQVSVKRKSDDEVVAELDSRAAHENGLVSLVGKAMNLVIDEIAAGEDLYFDYQEVGTIALTNAQLSIEHYPY